MIYSKYWLLFLERILEGLELKFSGNKLKAEDSESASDTEMDDNHKVTKLLT